MSFPTKVEYEEGIVDAGEPVFENAAAYLLWLRDTYIQDTPFKYGDVEEIHEEVQELRPDLYYYKWVSVRNHLRLLIKQGAITVLDGHEALPQNHMLMWTCYYQKRILEVRSSTGRVAASQRYLRRVLELLSSDVIAGESLE